MNNIRRVGAEFFREDRVDRRTYLTKLTVAFLSFVNALKKKGGIKQPELEA